MTEPAAAGSIVSLHRLAILGAGEEGSWLAQRAARAGYRVVLEDLMPARRRAAALRIDDASLVYPVSYAGSVEEAVREADLVIDFVPDELESKLEILSLLDRMAPPHTVLATPTRVLSIADLASCTYRGERVLALRLPATAFLPFEIEIVQGPQTFPSVVEAVAEFWVSLGAAVNRSTDLTALP